VADVASPWRWSTQLQDRYSDARARHEWLDHLARAGVRYHARHGNHLAAAIAFFSILNAVPLLMVAFAVAGYTLSFNPDLLATFKARLADAVPTALADAVQPVIDAAVEQRNAVAGLGLIAALWAGMWWMFNLREALSAQWGIPPRSLASVRSLLSDLGALAGLWIALICSLAITALGTGVGDTILGLLGWQGTGWSELTRGVLALAAGLVADWLICYWILTWLPRTAVPAGGAARAAVVGAIGFEVLRHALTAFLGGVTGSPGGAVFGSLLGLLVFAYLVGRFLLLLAAWAATGSRNQVLVRADPG
jgi:membrane protein